MVRFERGFHVAALQLEAVDLALNVLEPRTRVFSSSSSRAHCGLADDAVGLLFGGRLDVVGELLRGQSASCCEALLVLAMLVEHGLHVRQILAQAIGFTQRLLVVVGDRGKKRADLDLVEAAESRCGSAAGAGRAG